MSLAQPEISTQQALLEELANNERSDRLWQKKMLPLMAKVVLGLTVFFFLVSLVQLTFLHMSIKEAPQLNLEAQFQALEESGSLTFEQRYKVAQLRALTELDAGTMERRYHQVNVGLMARVWTRYMGFVTGMILAIMGGLFIMGKLREPTSVTADTMSAKGLIMKTASPGMVMTMLGVILMVITIVVNHRIEVTDRPGFIQYLHGGEAVGDFVDLPELPSSDAIPDDF